MIGHRVGQRGGTEMGEREQGAGGGGRSKMGCERVCERRCDSKKEGE